jgi:hypothetical protein
VRLRYIAKRRRLGHNASLMRHVILIISLLTNLVGVVEAATDLQDVCSDFGVPSSTSTIDSSSDGDTNSGTDPLETVACDHCCHSASHYAGFAVVAAPIPFEKLALTMRFESVIYYRLPSAPPTPPPNA